jgi:hypothetical protein
MEPHMIDYYNDEPQIVHIINKQNEEFAEATETIRSLQKENRKLRKITKELDKLKAPSIVESGKDEEGYCLLEDRLIDICLEVCGGDEDNDEPLCDMIIEGYQGWIPGKPLNKDSIIKRFTDELNKVTGYKNPRWCFTSVIGVCESMGFDDQWLQPGIMGPRIDIYELARDLADLGDFGLPTILEYVS